LKDFVGDNLCGVPKLYLNTPYTNHQHLISPAADCYISMVANTNLNIKILSLIFYVLTKFEVFICVKY